MPFPNDDNGALLSQQAILGGVAGVSAGAGVLRVSSLTEVTVALENDASVNRVSAFSNDAAQFRVSAFGVNIADITNTDAADLRVSAFSDAAGQLRTSAIQGDAGLLLVSATLRTGSYVSAVIDNGSVSAKSNDAAQLRVSAFSGDAGTLLVSATLRSGSYVSAVIDNGSVSAKSNDAAQFRVSAFSGDAGTMLVSASVRSGAYVSAVIDNGSVSAKSNDAAQHRVSAFQGDAVNLNVSAKSGDGATFRVSSLESAVTTATGGASTFSTSAGIAQLSAIKSSSGRLYGWYLFNRAGAAQYLQFFNVSAITSVALGTDVPALTLGVPDTGNGANAAFAPGASFSNGIVVGVTSAPNGATAGASAMVVNLFFA